MIKLKNQFKTIYLFLIIFVGLLFIFNNHQVMATKNNQNKTNWQAIYNIKFQNLSKANKNDKLKISYYVKDKNLSFRKYVWKNK